MNYYWLAIALITLIFGIVIAKLIFKIHELYVKVKTSYENIYETISIIKDHIIRIKEMNVNITNHLEYQFNHLNEIESYIRNELTDELNAIGRTTSQQADIMLKLEGKISEKEGNIIESE